MCRCVHVCACACACACVCACACACACVNIHKYMCVYINIYICIKIPVRPDNVSKLQAGERTPTKIGLGDKWSANFGTLFMGGFRAILNLPFLGEQNVHGVVNCAKGLEIFGLLCVFVCGRDKELCLCVRGWMCGCVCVSVSVSMSVSVCVFGAWRLCVSARVCG